MKKEPFLFYLTRLLVYVGIFILMAMLYWSSLLIEGHLQTIGYDVKEIQKELGEIQSENDKLRELVQRGNFQTSSLSPQQPPFEAGSSKDNLLTPDPFYQTTLPHMLGPGFRPHGQRHEAVIARPDNLMPFAGWKDVMEWYGLCVISLTTSKVGIYETYCPAGAVSMEMRKNEKGQEEYYIQLRKDLFWAPLEQRLFGSNVTLAPQFLRKQPVTAHDYKFYFDAFMNKGVESLMTPTLRQDYSDVEEFKVIDDYTFTVRWKTKEIQQADGTVIAKPAYRSKLLTAGLSPLPSFVYKYFANGKKIVEDDAKEDTYRTNLIWAQNFSHHWANNYIVSCGAWIFDGMTDREVRFKRNPDYFNPLASLVTTLTYAIKSSTDGVWEDFKAGNLDSITILPYQHADLYDFMRTAAYRAQAQQHKAIKTIQYLERAYTYLGWNEAKPYFKSKKVRQALTMAIDRERIIRQNLNGNGIQTTGTFFPLSPSYDPSIKPYSYDPQRALELLHEEGWYDSQGNGVLSKEIDGQQVPFRFTLTYYMKNLNTKAVCEYVATALKEVGIECVPNGVEIADLSKVFEDRNFDALYLAWGLGAPPESPRQIWYTAEENAKGSSNAIGFSNKEIDAIIDELEYEYDPIKRKELFYRFDAILHEEAPYTFLYVPKTMSAYREYLQNVFIPADRQDLIPGANVGEPISSLFWIKTP